MPALETLIEILVGTYMPLLKVLAALLKKIRSDSSLVLWRLLTRPTVPKYINSDRQPF